MSHDPVEKPQRLTDEQIDEAAIGCMLSTIQIAICAGAFCAIIFADSLPAWASVLGWTLLLFGGIEVPRRLGKRLTWRHWPLALVYALIFFSVCAWVVYRVTR